MLRERGQFSTTRVIACYDDYSHGPLIDSDSTETFFSVRQRFWRSVYVGLHDTLPIEDGYNDHQTTTLAVENAQSVELWCSCNVQDQIHAVVLFHLLELEGVDLGPVKLLQFGQQEAPLGLGPEGAERLADLSNRITPADIDLDLYRDAWRAISQDSAAAIHAFITEHCPSLPLVKALSNYLLRYAEFNEGLGSIDRALLAAGSTEFRHAGRVIGRAMALGKPELDTVSDLLLLRRLVDLIDAQDEPWFEWRGERIAMRDCEIRLSAAGLSACSRYEIEPL